MKITTKILMACLPGIVSGALFAASTGEQAVSKPNDAAMSKVKTSLGKLPLSFEPNRGQTDPRVQFLSRGPGYTVFFTKDGTVLSLRDTQTSNAVVRMKLVGGNNAATPLPVDALPRVSNYLKGSDPSRWQTEIPEYSQLRYQDAYPGIDVLYQGEKQKSLRYDFIVKPGADPSVIAMAYEGADKISLNQDGDLLLTIDGKTLVTTKPFTYQEEGGTRKEIASHFILKDGRVSFELAKYDASKELVIDPGINFVTFLGGLLNDSVNGVAIANPTLTISSSPSAYFVTGTTASANFPATPTGAVGTGVVQQANTGDTDVFVTKINFKGSAIVWSTYLGGNSQDSGNAITVDIVSGSLSGTNCASGCPIITGQTYSGNFPTLPFQGSNNMPNLSGTNDAFATKLNATGTALVYSMYLGGVTNDIGTGVTVDLTGNVFVGGYTDSPYFLCPGGVIPQPGTNQCTNANHNTPTSSSDAFVVKIPVSFQSTSNFGALQSALYGGFGAEFARAIAYNPYNGMVYLAGDTTTGAQNFVAPNNTNLPGITNNTVNQYKVAGASGANVTTGLPGPSGNARGGFVVAFDATTFVRTFASYVAVSPATGTCGIGTNTITCNQGYESITGVAAEGGTAAAGCNATTLVCTPSSAPAAGSGIASTYGNIGHVYITGNTTSHVTSTNIASVVPGFSCQSPLAAASINASGPNAPSFPITGPTGLPVIFPGGLTTPAGCTTALYTQIPFSTNQAVVSGCPFPLPTTFVPTATCNFSAFVGILDGALLIAPVTGAANYPIGNQIEYWAYYSSNNSSTVSNALAIDMNPITLTSVYSLGTYQQMYITGGTQITASGLANQLPVTNAVGTAASTGPEIFTSYNVGTTTGGGIGGYTPKGVTLSTTLANEVDAFVARFNPNGLAGSNYGGQGCAAVSGCTVTPATAGVAGSLTTLFEGYEIGNVVPPNDHSFLIHTPQFNYGEFLYSLASPETSNGQTPMTVGNAIAVDPTRAVLIGGATNVTQTASTSACSVQTSGASIGSCQFTTTNALAAVGGTFGYQPNGGNDGWASVLFFNDILTDANSISTANPWLQPGFPQKTPSAGTTSGCQPGGIVDGVCSYIETTPAPFGPTFDFAISDPSTQTQSFRVLFTGQTSGLLPAVTPWFVPLDPRSGATQPTVEKGLAGTGIAYPGSGIAYYIPCANPSATGTLNPGSTPASPGYYNNAYPAPGNPYGPQNCSTPPIPNPNLYETIPMLFSGYPGLTPAQIITGTYVTPGWLLVSQDINPGVVRLQLDRRAAAGLLEGTYVAQFLVTTYDSQNPAQWPPCGPSPSVTNPFNAPPTGGCTNPNTPLPADNVSVLVTVRLIVRPTLFLSRNSGILTGVTSSLSANPLSGPKATITVQQGTSIVPDWWYTGASNDTSLWPTGSFGLGSILTSGQPANANATGDVCVPGPVVGTTVSNVIPIVPQLGDPANPHDILVPPGVTVPCPVTATNPLGPGVYFGNGPGDLSAGPIGTAPTMTFLYDLGTVLVLTAPTGTIQPNTLGSLEACGINPNDITNNQIPNECNLSIEQNLAPSRPDQPAGVVTFNAEWQGGQDPLTQRNDATIHDYYIEAEGAATLSVAAINCTNWGVTNGSIVHNPAVGNWLGVQIGGVSVNKAGAPTVANYTPICTDLTASTIGTAPAPATLALTATACPGPYDDCADALATAPNPAPGGRKVVLDFVTKAFSNRPALNGIPTGLYTAQVYVWASRAKNSVPGYCLGSDFTIDGNGPGNLCAPSTTAMASTANPHPEVLVTNQQFFNVSLMVFDTTQVIQITPNSCPTPIATPQTELATVGGAGGGLVPPENLNTGNITPPYGPGSGYPNYPNFGNNGSNLVQWSLLPFQTTGAGITSCGSNINNICTANANFPVPLPANVKVNPQTLVQYNACALPTGFFGTTPITGQTVPGIGTLGQSSGPQSQITFIPQSNATNAQVTIYACRPTVAPAWLNSALYPGNALAAPGSPEPYANGNGPQGFNPNVGFVTAVTGCSATGDPAKTQYPGCATGMAPVPSVNSVTCALAPVSTGCGNSCGGPPTTPAHLGLYRGPNMFLEDNTGANSYVAGSTRYIAAFFSNTGVIISTANGGNGVLTLYQSQATDIAVAGDWTGDGFTKVGFYRPTTGQWFLDTNNDGTFDAGDTIYAYGGITGDTPVVGDWLGTGKSCIGLFRSGFLWILDSNCNGAFDAADAVFPFGGIGGDVPVVGNFFGSGKSTVGVVRKYAPGGVPQGNPFYWVLDAGNATSGGSPSAHQPAAGSFPYGGVTGDVFIVGDWLGTGTDRAGVYRSGNWIEDTTGQHTYDTFFQFGGVPTDQPLPGKWKP